MEPSGETKTRSVSESHLTIPSLPGSKYRTRSISAGNEPALFYEEKLKTSDYIEDGNIDALRGAINSSTDFEHYFTVAFRQNDSAMINVFLHHPECERLSDKLKLDYLKRNLHKVRNNSILVDMVINILLRHVKLNDFAICELMVEALRCDSSQAVLESCDRLLEASFPNESEQCKMLKDIYRKSMHGKNEMGMWNEDRGSDGVASEDNALLDHRIALCGIDRHIKLLVNSRTDPINIALIRHLPFSLYSSPSLQINSGENTKDIKQDTSLSFQTRLKFANTAISQKSQNAVYSDTDLYREILSRMDISPNESSAVKNAMHRFMHGLADMIAETDPNYRLKPILTGSAAEGTRNYFPNEFDYVLLFLSE